MFLLRMNSNCDRWSVMSACSRFFSSRSTCSTISVSSRFSKACFSWICSRSMRNSSMSVATSRLKSSSRASKRLCWTSRSRSTFKRWLRTATWCCSSASSKSRSSICKMASFRSTSRSWFWEMISTCFLSCFVFADLMIFSQLSWILLMLYLVFFISNSASWCSKRRRCMSKYCSLSCSCISLALVRLPATFLGGMLGPLALPRSTAEAARRRGQNERRRVG
mmetsp:Transcript_12730/g.28858  ORF Transcript_12730/g.28858 Transcript_12730/m.28858 type:complete len:222 (+) Transcript_12730:998-1663(+)